MSRRTPLRELHQSYLAGLSGVTAVAETGHRPGAATGARVGVAEIETIAYGPAKVCDAKDDGDAEAGDSCEIIALYDTVETEYGALRSGAGFMDGPQRGTLIITGDERVDFLNRMLTQQLADFNEGDVCESFLVNRKGRVLADVLLVAMADRVLIDIDIHQAAPTVEALAQFLFAEDVQISEATETMYRLGVHGPKAKELLERAMNESLVIEPMRACSVMLADKEVVIARRDQIGDCGYELFVRCDDAKIVWQAMLDTAAVLNGDGPRGFRPVGWYAWNMARIEAGTPMMNIDFDTTSLPHETSVVQQRVSFTKGCYPGQEVIARMQNLGQPKQRLVGVRVDGDILPEAGMEVFALPDEDGGSIGEPVGVITSSTISPMLGAVPIALAMLRSKSAPDGATVVVAAEGQTAQAGVCSMMFWSRKERVAT